MNVKQFFYEVKNNTTLQVMPCPLLVASLREISAFFIFYKVKKHEATRKKSKKISTYK
jgi:hypothetical protein